jgi:hypothetical protein
MIKWWRLQLSALVHRIVRRDVTALLCCSCGQLGVAPGGSSCAGAGVRSFTARVFGCGFDSVVVKRSDGSLMYLPLGEEGNTWACGVDTLEARALLAAEALR